MKLRTMRALGAFLFGALVASVGTGTAAAPAIGTASASGNFRLDRANVRDHATLFEGSLIETAGAASTVSLSSGARVSLEAASRGRIFGDRLVLEKGESRLDRATGFHLEALGLRVTPDRGASSGRVSFDGARRVRVAAITGSFRVLNAHGQLVANLPAGAVLAFEPQQGASGATRVTGVLEIRGGRYLITDEVTNVTVEIVGLNNAASEAGQRLELTGTLDAAATPAAGASEVIRVTQSRRLPAAAAAGQGGKSAGGITATTVTLIGGVAAAAVVGGLAATDALPGQGGGLSR